jgi:hypothetical protein
MNKVRTALALVAMAIILAGCQSYQRTVVPFKMPQGYPNATNASGAIIAARAYDDKTEAQGAFGFDIIGAGLLPVQVIFDNRGTHTLEVVTGQTFLIDAQNNMWPILDATLAYDRIDKKTSMGRVVPEAAKGGVLGGAAGAIIGAAIGIVSGTNVGSAAGMGAAAGAAVGAVIGGGRGLADTEVQGQIRDDLYKHSLHKRPIKPMEVAYGFVFFPGEAAKPLELRLQVRETDTGMTQGLILKF